MKPFFTAEDFGSDHWTEEAAEIANAKLEREGKVFYGRVGYKDDWRKATWDDTKFEWKTHKTLMLPPEPIE